jgi:hypothetical protein
VNLLPVDELEDRMLALLLERLLAEGSALTES